MNKKIKGRVTIPGQEGMDSEVREIISRWGADAIRNSDGTQLTDSLVKMTEKVYATYKLCRNDQEWAANHKKELQQVYLMSEHVTAVSSHIEIDIMKGYYKKQLAINEDDNPKEWWEVIDRTTGDILDKNQWNYNRDDQKVIINNACSWHNYTVSFLAYIIWDPVHMFNHITNNWTTPPQMPYDVRYPSTRKHVLKYLEKWLKENGQVDVVRFTTFFYNFTLIFDEEGKEKYVDWFGYSASVSPKAIKEFQKEFGYRLRPEHFVDQGYHNNSFRVPTKEFLDWMDFQQRFVANIVKECVELCHKYDKEAMMFLGDHWIGTEPYGKYFSETGLDAVVGSVGSGATTRMISDIPGVKYTEGRFLPYFFPTKFKKGEHPEELAIKNWLQARRAILRKPLDRMGYGGYLSLAYEHPDFVEIVEQICNQFREIHNKINGSKPYSAPFKVGVLNSWGKKRTWMTNMVAHALRYRETYSYVGIIECLSGMPLDIEFISFEDIKHNGIDENISVIINAGDEGTAFSGGNNWLDEDIVSKLRKWVYDGGGLIGVGEPTACKHGGRYFQLADVLGVDREIGYTLSYTKYDEVSRSEHFILQDQTKDIDFGESKKSIRQISNTAKTLIIDQRDTLLSVNEYGKGRAVYMTGLPYSQENTRLLLRSIFWAAGRENDMFNWYSLDIRTECSYYPDSGYVAILNNSYDSLETKLYKDKYNMINVKLNPKSIKWVSVKDI